MTLTAPAAVTVEKKPVVVEYKEFDPRRPPDDMPPLGRGHVAVEAGLYDCKSLVNYTMDQYRQRNGKWRTIYSVTGVKVSISLKITVWLPKNVEPWLKAHEDGHREIDERFYLSCEIAARQAGDKIDGRRIIGEGDDKASSQEAAEKLMQAANDTVVQTYMDLTQRQAAKVQKIYDELTDHGSRRTPNEKEAIRLAFERWTEETRQAATRPATRPTTRPAARPSASGRDVNNSSR